MNPIYVYAGMSEKQKRAYVAYERARRNKLLRAFRDMITRVAHNALGENADLGLVRSMIQRKFNLKEERAFTATLKRRAQLAQRYGAPVSIFRDVSIDAPLADELALAQSYRTQSGGTDAEGTDSAKVKDSLETIKETQVEHGDFLINAGRVLNEIKANTQPHTPPRASDREVPQPLAAQILTDAGYSVTTRQVQNWEHYINTRGEKGTKPPEGYSIELRNKYLDFKRWAESAAKGRRMKRAVAERRRKEHKTNA